MIRNKKYYEAQIKRLKSKNEKLERQLNICVWKFSEFENTYMYSAFSKLVERMEKVYLKKEAKQCHQHSNKN